MSYATWEAIAETPWWVYLIMFLLMMVGYAATKPRYIHLKPELAMQSISMAMLLGITSYYLPFNSTNLSLTLSGLATGYMVGWLHFRFRNIQAVKGYTAVYVSGSWLALVLIPCLIAAKYWYFGHRYYLDLEVLQSPIFHHYMATLAGLSFGLFLGRTTILLRRLRIGPYIEAPQTRS